VVPPPVRAFSKEEGGWSSNCSNSAAGRASYLSDFEAEVRSLFAAANATSFERSQTRFSADAPLLHGLNRIGCGMASIDSISTRRRHPLGQLWQSLFVNDSF